MLQKVGKKYGLFLLVFLLLVTLWTCQGCSREDPLPPPDPSADDPENGEQPEEEEADEPLEETIALYFTNGQAEKLIRETRQVVVEDQDINVLILEELIKGPESPEMGRTIPGDTRVHGVDVNEGLALADFSEELRASHWGGSTGEILTVYSVVNTLAERPDIQRVQFLIDGEAIETLTGHMELSDPVEPDLGWVE